MKEYLANVNSGILYLIVACILAFVTLMCVVFLVKSYRAGIKIGMDKQVLKRTIISSATFTLLPSLRNPSARRAFVSKSCVSILQES